MVLRLLSHLSEQEPCEALRGEVDGYLDIMSVIDIEYCGVVVFVAKLKLVFEACVVDVDQEFFS